MTTIQSIALGAIALSLMAFAPSGQARKESVIDVALKKAFPGCEMTRVTIKLDEKQREKIGKIAGQAGYAKRSTFVYLARRDGKVVGSGFFDSHVVRTKRETVLVKVDPMGTVQGLETIVFQEPTEYIAQDSFYDSLKGRGQGRPLQLGRGLDGTTGATLTCRAVADASRRVLALHEVLGEKAGRSAKAPATPKKKIGK